MENKVFMPPPPKNLRNMPPPPPRQNKQEQTNQAEVEQDNLVSEAKVEQSQSNEIVQAHKTEEKIAEKGASKAEKEVGTEIENQSTNETAQEVEKSSGGRKFLYWGGFVLCLVAMVVAIYMLVTP